LQIGLAGGLMVSAAAAPIDWYGRAPALGHSLTVTTVIGWF